MNIHCPRCNQEGIASALVSGLCTACANEERGILINLTQEDTHGQRRL